MTTVITRIADQPVVPARAGMTPVVVGDWYIDLARPIDRAALEDLFARCSAETIRLRFFGPRRDYPRRYLTDVLANVPEVHDAVVARHRVDGRLAGLASLAAGSAAGPDVPELGVFVVDDEQRRGVGTAMVGVLLARARQRGVARIVASVLPGRTALLDALSPLERERTYRTGDSIISTYRL